MAKRANTKKSVVGKTSKARTSKTRAASATKKRTTKKPTKPTTAKKQTTAKKSTAKKSTAKKQQAALAALRGRLKWLNASPHSLRGLHIISAVVFAALIAFVYTIMDSVERTVIATYAASDALRGEEVLAPAVRDLHTVDLRHVLAVLLAVGIVYSVVLATRGWSTYISRAEKGPLKSRWIFAAILGAGGIKTVALLNGVYDVIVLSLLAILVAGAAFAAYRSDIETGAKRKTTHFLTAVVTAVVAIFALVVFIAFSMVYGATLPLHVYFAADVFALGLLAYAVTQLFQLKGRKGFTQPAAVERNYAIITTVGLTLFAALLIASNVA